MEWVLRSPQIHSIFSNLGYVHADGYHVNENCNDALEAILLNILTEDKYLRTYRRSISFGENIKKDLIPLLIHAKEDKTIELLTRILVNLTIPIECLLSVDIISKNDFGRHTIFEINNLLASTKVAFTDHRATKVIIDFLKKSSDSEHKMKLLPEQCSNVSNSLLLLRNILHIPEDKNAQSPSYSGPTHTVQNQIIWNIFSQSIDKVLIKLISSPDACNWGVTLVQFIALLYKDQHVVKLHKMLNIWLETSLSESSEDNESNTPLDRGSDDSSSMLTSDPTSDSSDTGGKNEKPMSANNEWLANNDPSQNENNKETSEEVRENIQNDVEATKNNDQNNVEDSKFYNDNTASCSSGIQSEQTDPTEKKSEKKTGVSETSDCGYGTQIENQGSISTSSNEDDQPFKKPVHQKPHNPKQRANTKARTGSSTQDRKRKKIVKRGKSNIINVHGLTHKTPTDDDISKVLKEFTVDFLLKGYNSLVQTLHSEILTNQQLAIDTSHFFWLVTYFLKFATQIELDLEHLSSVLSFDIASYLTAEGVNLCEQFELAVKLDKQNLTSIIRRLHLVVTAIREFVQAIEEYKKISNLNKENQDALIKLQIKMCDAEELRTLLVLLIRHYNPKYHSRQYLQDLIVTNHILLIFLDNIMKCSEYNGSATMVEHLRQYATPEVMYKYGELLEDYNRNGEFVNDCIFTVMHHVGGDLGCVETLFQPKILKTFASIWQSDYEICDDWTDLVEYVLNKFTKKPSKFQTGANFIVTPHISNDKVLKLISIAPSQTEENGQTETETKPAQRTDKNSLKERWTEEEISSLSWTYLQCNLLPDVIGEMMKLLKEDSIMKSNDSIIRELYKQKIIKKDEYRKLMKGDSDKKSKSLKTDRHRDDISKMCMQLVEDGKSKSLDWVQKVLLETCYAKICLEKKKKKESAADSSKLLNFEVFKKKADDMSAVSPVSYHCLMLNQSVPLVPWNCEQAAVCKDLKFLHLLNKLGFHMPVDSGKVFIRIPHFWTADYIYDVAGKISPVDTSKLKFSLNEFTNTGAPRKPAEGPIFCDDQNDTTMLEPENYYQVHKQTHFATMVNFTPMPGCSYNSEANEIDNYNWLKVVQKSQEFKLTLNSESPENIGVQSGTVVPPNSPYMYTAAASAGTSYSSSFMSSSLVTTGGVPLLMPTIMTVKQEVSTFSVIHHVDNEGYNNSETASVASDLTRMYVSDEDDKSEDLGEAESGDTVRDTDTDIESDSELSSERPAKRPRLSYGQSF